jgi:hypothetical protein
MLRLPVTARLLWTLGITLVLLAGCYTVIVHPKIEGEKLSREYLRANCIDCHADYHVYPYDPYEYYFGANYFWDYPQFGYYYSYPWWWDDYYWDYYLFGDDPTFLFSLGLSLGGGEYDDREPFRPDYHRSIPPRSQGEVAQTDSSGIDTTPVDDDEPKEQVRTQPMHIPPDMSSQALEGRSTGKPPWSRPKGWWGAKPPRLRVISAKLESKPKGGSKSSKKSSGKTVGSSTSSSEKSDEKEDDNKAEEKTEEPEPEPAERRGRPKRGPP